MTEELACFRCGASLAALSLPIGRRDECPDCAAHLHVCRMCRYFDPAVPGQCREDDAEEVMEKEKVNFCEWYQPATGAFDPLRAGEGERAKAELAALFGEQEGDKPAEDELLKNAEELFKSS